MIEKRTHILSTMECGLINDRLSEQWNKITEASPDASIAELAERAGINEVRLQRMLRGSQVLVYDEYEAVAACMGLKLDELLTPSDEVAEPEEEPPFFETERGRILYAAIGAVCCDREEEYGSPGDNLRLTAQLWSDYLQTKISAGDVALMMVLLKVSRVKSGRPKADSFVDMAGYSAIAGELTLTQEAEHEIRTDG